MKPQELVLVGLFLVVAWPGEAISMLLNLFLEWGALSCIPKRKVFPFLFPHPQAKLSTSPLYCKAAIELISFFYDTLQVYIYPLQPPVQSQGYHTRTLTTLVLLCHSAGGHVCLIGRTYVVPGWEISNPGERKHKCTWISALIEL